MSCYYKSILLFVVSLQYLYPCIPYFSPFLTSVILLHPYTSTSLRLQIPVYLTTPILYTCLFLTPFYSLHLPPLNLCPSYNPASLIATHPTNHPIRYILCASRPFITYFLEIKFLLFETGGKISAIWR